MLNGNPIAFRSYKQRRIGTSSAKTELYSLLDGTTGKKEHTGDDHLNIVLDSQYRYHRQKLLRWRRSVD